MPLAKVGDIIEITSNYKNGRYPIGELMKVKDIITNDRVHAETEGGNEWLVKDGFYKIYRRANELESNNNVFLLQILSLLNQDSLIVIEDLSGSKYTFIGSVKEYFDNEKYELWYKDVLDVKPFNNKLHIKI